MAAPTLFQNQVTQYVYDILQLLSGGGNSDFNTYTYYTVIPKPTYSGGFKYVWKATSIDSPYVDNNSGELTEVALAGEMRMFLELVYVNLIQDIQVNITDDDAGTSWYMYITYKAATPLDKVLTKLTIGTQDYFFDNFS